MNNVECLKIQPLGPFHSSFIRGEHLFEEEIIGDLSSVLERFFFEIKVGVLSFRVKQQSIRSSMYG